MLSQSQVIATIVRHSVHIYITSWLAVQLPHTIMISFLSMLDIYQHSYVTLCVGGSKAIARQYYLVLPCNQGNI